MNKGLVRRMLNRLLGMAARFAPGATSLRPLLHRLRGVGIVGRVFIGDDVYLENEFPECIELHDGAQISVRSILIAHTRGIGKIVIGRDAFIGPNCVITAAPGATLRIGDGSVIAASSVVSGDVPPHTLVSGPKAGPVARSTVALGMTTRYEDFLGGLRPLKSTRPGSR